MPQVLAVCDFASGVRLPDDCRYVPAGSPQVNPPLGERLIGFASQGGPFWVAVLVLLVLAAIVVFGLLLEGDAWLRRRP
jgi:hypothetical protein